MPDQAGPDVYQLQMRNSIGDLVAAAEIRAVCMCEALDACSQSMAAGNLPMDCAELIIQIDLSETD